MNKRKVADRKGQNVLRFFAQKPILLMGGGFALLAILLIFSISLAQASTITVGSNETVDLLCDGRGFQISRNSRTEISVTCQEGRGGQPATPTAEPPTPLPSPTAPPPVPTTQPPVPTVGPPETTDAIYVAPNGNDNASGSIDQPLKTIQAAINKVNPGETVFVRGGTYVEKISIDKNGTAQQPIAISAYPGESPVLDGEYTLPTGDAATCNNTVSPPKCFVYTPLVSIRGSHIVFSGIEVMHSRGRGITISALNGVRPQHVTIEKCTVHDVRSGAVMVMDADHITVQGCDVYHAANFATHDRSPNELNWPIAVNAINATNVTIAHNSIHENWGEGVASGRDSRGIRIVNNVIYNNYALQVYIHRAQDVTVSENLVYHTNDPAFNRGGNPSQCIVLNNETYFDGALTVKEVEVANNLITGCRKNIAIWGSGNSSLPIEDVLIAHNTLVEAKANGGQGAVGLDIYQSANLRNIAVVNNIVIQQSDDIAFAPDNAEVTFANNLWSRTPPAPVSGSGDFVGALGLAIESANLTPGTVNAEWFMIDVGSPAVNRGQSSEVGNDYFGNGRNNQPDMGAHEVQ